MYVDQNDLTEKQIRTDTLLLRQLQEEEREQFLKQNNQEVYDIPPKYHIGRCQIKTESKDKQLQETDDKAFDGLADWLLQNEKVSVLTNSQEYEMATAKSTSTTYRMLKRVGMTLVGKT